MKLLNVCLVIALLLLTSVQAEETIRFPDNSIYRGEIESGLLQGTGMLLWRDGGFYEGGFKNGLMHGQGTLMSYSGKVLSGEFLNGVPHGKQKVVYADGSRYEGEFIDGVENGKGTFTYANGSVYVGEVKNALLHGEGLYIDIHKNRYKGSFEQGRYHGKGKMSYANGDVYVGAFEKGYYHGEGLLTYSEGSSYEGGFSEGLFHGEGRYIYSSSNGTYMESGTWEYGELIEVDSEQSLDLFNIDETEEYIRLYAEEVFVNQEQRLQNHLSELEPEKEGVTDLYVVNFGAYGSQDVFMNEIELSNTLFGERFKAKGRIANLVNNENEYTKWPLATVSNLKKTLQHISEIMNPEEDILFLFLTSHGSHDHTLSVSLQSIPLRQLSAESLSGLLDEMGLKWKVVVVSACYSGGFIEPLQDGNSMVITSARHDRKSFGCGKKSELTYFGRAFFKESLEISGDFSTAFDNAKVLVTQWEAEKEYEHSEPQISVQGGISEKLQEWREDYDIKTQEILTDAAISLESASMEQ